MLSGAGIPIEDNRENPLLNTSSIGRCQEKTGFLGLFSFLPALLAAAVWYSYPRRPHADQFMISWVLQLPERFLHWIRTSQYEKSILERRMGLGL